MDLNQFVILIKGGGEIASGVAHRLHQCHFKLCLTELHQPLSVRRGVVFSEAVYLGSKEVEGVTARVASDSAGIYKIWQHGKLPILVDPDAKIKNILKPHVVIDAIMTKRNLGTSLADASLVIGLGVGFQAGEDVHAVIETNRGHNLGRAILHGKAEPNSGIPGEISGFTVERVLRAPKAGLLVTNHDIGDYAQKGQVIATVAGTPLEARVSGVIRGLLRNGTEVCQYMKVGDIDPRGVRDYCYTISDKARAIAGGVLEIILARFNMEKGKLHNNDKPGWH